MNESQPTEVDSSPVEVGVDVNNLQATQDGEARENTRNRKKTSWVWNHFSEAVDPKGVKKVKCNGCHNYFSAGSANGTTHLKNHFHRCKKNINKDIKQQMISVSKNIAAKEARISNFKFDQTRSRMDLARMIIKHEYPFNIVEHEYFQIFCNNMQPAFKLVSRNTIRSDVMKVHEEEKKRMYDIFDALPSRFSITTDLWTSDIQNIGYCCVTCHYIDEDWKLKKKKISFKPMEGSHDAMNLCKVIMDILLDWNIDRKLVSITVDNASTNDAMVREMKALLSDRLLLGGALFHVRCGAHVLNLMVQDGLKEIGGLLSKIRESVRYVRLTPQRKQKFQNAINQMHLEHAKEVCLDVPTRWNSTYLVLESALELKETFNRLAQIDKDYKSNPSKEEWNMGEIVRNCLKMFYDTTNSFSASTSPTANVFVSNICGIYMELTQWEESEHEFVRNMGGAMKLKFKKYWTDCTLPLAFASIFDPRCKLPFMAWYFKGMYGMDAEAYINRLRRFLFSLYSEYDNGESTQMIAANRIVSAPNNDEDPCKKSMRMFDDWYESESVGTYSYKIKSDLEKYLEEPLFPRKTPIDVLEWWKLESA